MLITQLSPVILLAGQHCNADNRPFSKLNPVLKYLEMLHKIKEQGPQILFCHTEYNKNAKLCRDQLRP